METKELAKIYLEQIDKNRDIYELAKLYSQNRMPISEFQDILMNPETGKKFTPEEVKQLTSNNIFNYISENEENSLWEKKNKQFLNYHMSLSVYEMINAMPIINYILFHSGLGLLKNINVADVGGGTGQSYCSSFLYPETIRYFLIDPNIRLLHDQFVRIFPKLLMLPIAHIRANAEAIPLADNTFDLTMSRASIDHMKDYKKFITEAKRITKIGGKIFITSHLDLPNETNSEVKKKRNIISFVEKALRYFYFRKYKVKSDDHTFHFETLEPIIEELKNNNLKIEKTHIFGRYFYILAEKTD